MKITISQFVTLDGVSQGPGSPDEDTSGGFTRGGWLVPHMDATFVRRASGWLDLADGLLLGRRTYEAFARDWPKITDPADPFAERMNTCAPDGGCCPARAIRPGCGSSGMRLRRTGCCSSNMRRPAGRGRASTRV
jgi:hypothetical protein